ncbi:MAG: SdrD B-like domain-containing protein, partial [Caldilineaceae bacterium]
GVTTTTDANGLYTFTVLAGTYSITETNPANYTSTGAEAGTTGSTVINTDRIDVTLTSGQTSLQNDFLDTKPITLTGSVFSDPAGNGTGTTGLASVPITLTGTNGLGQPITLTTTTGPTGAYTFTNLLPGTYTLVETNPTGYKSTSDVQGSPTDDTIVVTVTSGTNVTNQNFWDQAPLASIGDFVWYDVDGDGVQDSGEPGVPGVGISLTLPSGVVVNTTTNSSGIYSFTGLPAGTYTVTVNTATLPADFALTVGAQSAVSPLTVVLTQTQTYTTADFGFDVPTSYLLSKVLTSANPARTGEVVEFRITVTNTGKSVLTVLPMTDTFNAQFLQYVTASAVPDFNLNGTMRWNDLTTAASVGDLLPNTSKFITVTFLALRDTYLSPGTVTTNTVTISNGLADPDGAGPLGNVEPLTPATSNANVRIDGPTAVLLSNSQVKNEDGMVSINWTTVSENNILGFNVQRWDSQGRMTLVNAQPIGAQLAGQAAGAGYTLLDLTADSQELAAGGYTYVLEVLTLDGGTTLVELGGVSTQYTLFLPLLTR